MKNSADWWDEEFGPVALHIMDNPVLALDLAKSSMPTDQTLDIAMRLNVDGGDYDYNDEAPKQIGW